LIESFSYFSCSELGHRRGLAAMRFCVSQVKLDFARIKSTSHAAEGIEGFASAIALQ
jgi:hypothetical protein